MGKRKAKSKEVIITIAGGVAHLDKKDKGVFVRIIDEDCGRTDEYPESQEITID